MNSLGIYYREGAGSQAWGQRFPGITLLPPELSIPSELVRPASKGVDMNEP